MINMKAIYVDQDLHRLLKLRATERGVPLRQLVEDGVRAMLQPKGKEPVDVTTAEVTAAAAGGGSFDFLAREEEDIYLPTDRHTMGRVDAGSSSTAMRTRSRRISMWFQAVAGRQSIGWSRLNSVHQRK